MAACSATAPTPLGEPASSRRVGRSMPQVDEVDGAAPGQERVALDEGSPGPGEHTGPERAYICRGTFSRARTHRRQPARIDAGLPRVPERQREHRGQRRLPVRRGMSAADAEEAVHLTRAAGLAVHTVPVATAGAAALAAGLRVVESPRPASLVVAGLVVAVAAGLVGWLPRAGERWPAQPCVGSACFDACEPADVAPTFWHGSSRSRRRLPPRSRPRCTRCRSRSRWPPPSPST